MVDDEECYRELTDIYDALPCMRRSSDSEMPSPVTTKIMMRGGIRSWPRDLLGIIRSQSSIWPL